MGEAEMGEAEMGEAEMREAEMEEEVHGVLPPSAPLLLLARTLLLPKTERERRGGR